MAEGGNFGEAVDGLKRLADFEAGSRTGMAAAREVQSRARRDRAAAARRSIESSGMLNDLEVRRRLAMNLQLVVDDAKNRGTTRVSILKEIGMEPLDGKARLFHQYALDPDKPITTKRLERLGQKARMYLRLADAAAKLSGLDLDDTVLRLVEGTNFALAPDIEPDKLRHEYLEMIAAALIGTARRISAESDLRWYFRTIEQHGLFPSDDGWKAGFPLTEFRYAMPKVELLTRSIGQTPYDGSFSKAGNANRVWPAVVTACRRVAIALAPLGPNGEVRAYFATRPVLHLSATLDPIPDSCFALGVGEVVELPQQPRPVKACGGTFELSDDEWKRFDDTHGFPSMPGDEWEFVEVSPISIETVLKGGPPSWHSARDDLLAHPEMGFTKSPPGTIAAELEQAILYGQGSGFWGNGGPATTLPILLEEDARSWVKSLRHWVDTELAGIEETMSRLASGKRP